MRNPNGYGSVFKLSGNRRKPFAVRITKGWTDEGKRIYKYLSYHITRKEAMQALASYNANPYNVDESNITFGELYEKWSTRHYKNLSKNTIKGYETCSKYCKPIFDMKIKDIKIVHLQNLIDGLNKNHGTLKMMKNILKQIFGYAIELDIIQKDYSRFLKIGKHVTIKQKSIFNDKEIAVLWKNLDKYQYIDTILIMIYTGMRVGEMLNLRKEDINLIEQTIIVRTSKTEAGTNRIIPIHPRIKELIQNRYKNSNSDHLITGLQNRNSISYVYYDIRLFNPIMDELNIKHTPHDCRHTFATRLNDAGGNATAIKKMIGHESFALTEKVYTHKKVSELRKAIELVN